MVNMMPLLRRTTTNQLKELPAEPLFSPDEFYHQCRVPYELQPRKAAGFSCRGKIRPICRICALGQWVSISTLTAEIRCGSKWHSEKCCFSYIEVHMSCLTLRVSSLLYMHACPQYLYTYTSILEMSQSNVCFKDLCFVSVFVPSSITALLLAFFQFASFDCRIMCAFSKAMSINYQEKCRNTGPHQFK